MPRRVKDPAEARDNGQQTTLSTTTVQNDHRYQKHKEDKLSMEPLRTTINDYSVNSNYLPNNNNINVFKFIFSYQDQTFNGTIKQEFIVQDEQVFDRIIKQECLYEQVHYYERQLLETDHCEMINVLFENYDICSTRGKEESK
ncbi:hypothetical protein QTP88_000570 [Uroleucon formosanum]